MSDHSERAPRRSWGRIAALTIAGIGGAVVLLGLENIPDMLPERGVAGTCENIATEITERFKTNPVHPIRIFDITTLANNQSEILCTGTAWLSTGAEVKANFRAEFTPDGPFVFFEPIWF
jgi:hypothetical protein